MRALAVFKGKKCETSCDGVDKSRRAGSGIQHRGESKMNLRRKRTEKGAPNSASTLAETISSGKPGVAMAKEGCDVTVGSSRSA